jgi:outer membrane receptor protein involved in Fe transport
MDRPTMCVSHGQFRRGLRMFCFTLFAAMMMCGSALAQTSTGGIRGIVTDETGAVLAGVTVEATSPARIGGAIVEVTNDQGLYRFENLPIGEYVVTFTLEGFTTVRREGIRIEVGRTFELPAKMAVGNLNESLTVSADSPVVDTLHSTYKTSFNKEILENVPVLRTSWFDTVTFAPAVKANQVTGNSASFNIYGTTSAQNSYQVNGVEVSSPSGVVWDFANPDYFEEVAITGVGASAEYSGFQGGVVNIITKSGSNDFRGSSSFFYVGNKLVGSNGYPDATRPYPYFIDYNDDFMFSLGGPIKKDRIWFYTTQPGIRRRGSNIGVDPQFAAATHAYRPYGKITARLSSKDSVDFSINDNIFYSPNAASITRPLNTQTVENGHNPVVTANWKRQMNNQTLLEVKGGGIYIRDRLDPISGDFSTPGHNDTGTGIRSINTPTTTRWHMNRTSVEGALTRFISDFAGSHDLKTGVQVSNALQITNVATFGGVTYSDVNGAPDQATFTGTTSIGGVVKGVGVYAQDNWTLTNRLTLNLGVRFDHTTGAIPDLDEYDTQAKNATGNTFPGLGTIVTFNDPSPRIGGTYKLDSNGKTVAKASFGRYFGRLAVATFQNVGNGNVTSSVYRYNPATAKYDNLLSTTDPRANIANDPGLKNQYTNQFFASIEREILPNFGIDASFVYKDDQRIIGILDTRSTFAAAPFVDSFNGVTQTITVFNRTSSASSALNVTANQDDWYQTYKSFIIQGNKRLSKRWSLQTSYQWQRGLGTLSTQNFTTNQNPNTLINFEGRLSTDSTQTYRASGILDLPYRIRLGIRESYESGRPIARQVTVRGLAQGNATINAEVPGGHELPSLNDLQIRVDKDVPLGGAKRLRFSVDLFNIFNVNTPITVQTVSGQAVPFLTTTDIFLPRRAQIGVRFEF